MVSLHYSKCNVTTETNLWFGKHIQTLESPVNLSWMSLDGSNWHRNKENMQTPQHTQHQVCNKKIASFSKFHGKTFKLVFFSGNKCLFKQRYLMFSPAATLCRSRKLTWASSGNVACHNAAWFSVDYVCWLNLNYPGCLVHIFSLWLLTHITMRLRGAASSARQLQRLKCHWGS